MDHDSTRPSFSSKPAFVFYTDVLMGEGIFSSILQPTIQTAHVGSAQCLIAAADALATFAPDVAWVAIRSPFVRTRLVAVLGAAGVPVLLLNASARWVRAWDVGRQSLDLRRIHIRTLRRAVSGMMRVARALSSPGFICVDVADLHVFLNHPAPGVEFLAESAVFDDRSLRRAFVPWMTGSAISGPAIVDATVCVELSRSVPDLSGLFWYICNQLQTCGAVEPPSMLPLIPMETVHRRGSTRITRLLAIAAL